MIWIESTGTPTTTKDGRSELRQARSKAPNTPDQFFVEADNEYDRSDKCYAELIFGCLLEPQDNSRPLKDDKGEGIGIALSNTLSTA